MAKRNARTEQPGGRGTKSAAIREILGQNPRTPVKDIVSQLGERGITVQPNQVYLIKSKMRQQRRRQKRERVMQASHNAGIANAVELILKVKTLANDAGGISKLKQLVDALAE